jgi:hypothetical protein
MIINYHMKAIVQACFPESMAEARRLWHDIKPVKFGNRFQWPAAGGFNQVLADYQIPEDGEYLLILKTECYVFTDTAAAPGFRNFEPPPSGGGAAWFINTGSGPSAITGQIPIHIITDSSEFLIVKSGLRITLEATLNSTPDANVRFICTTVYAYHISALIADQVGSGEAFMIGANTS